MLNTVVQRPPSRRRIRFRIRGQSAGSRSRRLLVVQDIALPPSGLSSTLPRMGIFGRKRTASSDVDELAAKAVKAGQAIYVRRIHRVPGDIDGRRLSTAIQRIEAAGYRMEHQHHGGQGLQQWVEITFRAVELKV
ncbi:hypothetical protein [Kitasatospora purpeofusca]|uniref:hypothetical protein n=1 Tax=Kitasatospora purpeofusca TaxID=67352 RepID=UPI00367EAD81